MKQILFTLMLFLVLSPSSILAEKASLSLRVRPREYTQFSVSEMEVILGQGCKSQWGCDPDSYACNFVLYRDGKKNYEGLPPGIPRTYYDRNLSPSTTYCYDAKIKRCKGGSKDFKSRCNTTYDYYIRPWWDNNRGIILCDGDAVPYSVWGNIINVYADSERTFFLVPRKGYRVKDVIVDEISVGAVKSYTFTNIFANHTIVVHFEEVVPLNFLQLLLLDR